MSPGEWRRHVALAGMLASCAAPPAQSARAEPAPTSRNDAPAATLESVLGGKPDLVITIHPPALARDSVYGPLLRRASELAAAYAGPTNLGTTALAVIQRTEEVVVAARQHGKEAVIVLRGVPADVDPLLVVDSSGKAIWRVAPGDIRTTSRELEPVQPADAALFVTPGLLWVIASGAAVADVRAAVIAGMGAGGLPGDETSLLSMSLPGDALPQLRQGAMSPVGAGLLRVQLELTPGTRGVIVGKLSYPDAAGAASAEGTVLAVTLAFRHRLEEDIRTQADGGLPAAPRHGAERPASNLEWLGAAKVDRDGAVVVIRAPIPRPWLELLAHADVSAPSP